MTWTMPPEGGHPGREIVAVDARPLLARGIHCITRQRAARSAVPTRPA